MDALKRKLRKTYHTQRPISEAEAAQMAVQVARQVPHHDLVPAALGSQAPTAADPATGFPLRMEAVLHRINRSFTTPMNAVLRTLEGVFGLLMEEREVLRGKLAGLQEKLGPAQLAAAEAMQESHETKAIAMTVDDPHHGVRRLPTILYAPGLAAAALFSGVLNSTALRIFRQGDLTTLGWALFFAGVYTIAVHVVGLAFIDRSRQRRLRVGAGIAVLLGLIVSTLAFSDLRAAYLTALGRHVSVATFLALSVVVDVVGVCLAIFHSSVHADAIWLRDRRLTARLEEAQAIKEDILDQEHSLGADEQAAATLVAEHLYDVWLLGSERHRVISTFFSTLGQLTGLTHTDTATLMARFDGQLDYPPPVWPWVAWLNEHAEPLGRPRHRLGLLPPSEAH